VKTLRATDGSAFWDAIGKPGAKVRCIIEGSILEGHVFEVIDSDWSSSQVWCKNPDDITGTPIQFYVGEIEVLVDDEPKRHKCKCGYYEVINLGCRCGGR